jgi:hypothetical protein
MIFFVNLLVLISFTIFNTNFVNCITYLRPKNDRGPSTCYKCLKLKTIITTSFIHFEGATKAGVDCIEQVERYYFKNKDSQQVQNIAVFNTKNMTSPALEIEVEYLFALHDRVLHQESEEDSFQLRVISDLKKKQIGVNDITLTDFYAIIADSIESVIIKNISKIFFLY